MTRKKRTLKDNLPYILIICGLIITLSAFFLSIDVVKILQNPSYKPSCDINPVVSCGSVIKTHQASVFGFPNPYIGLFAGGIVVATGAAMLAGAQFKKWYWQGMELGTVLGTVFIGWLFYESLFTIHDLCPYCMAVWVATITSLWYVSLFNIDQGNIKLSKKLSKPYAWVRKHHADLIVLIFLVIAAFILHHFWYYYGKHL